MENPSSKIRAARRAAATAIQMLPDGTQFALVAGYAILDLPSKAAAIEWAMRFGEVVKVNEVEVRQMPEW